MLGGGIGSAAEITETAEDGLLDKDIDRVEVDGMTGEVIATAVAGNEALKWNWADKTFSVGC